MLAAVSAYMIYKEIFDLALIFFVFSAFLDLVDGSVARYQNRVTSAGAYLDTIIDRYVEFFILFALMFVSYPRFVFSARTWIILAIFGSLMTTYAKSAGFEKGREIRGGIMERAERLIFIFGIILASWFFRLIAIYLIVLFAVLVNVSAVQRIWIGLINKKN